MNRLLFFETYKLRIIEFYQLLDEILLALLVVFAAFDVQIDLVDDQLKFDGVLLALLVLDSFPVLLHLIVAWKFDGFFFLRVDGELIHVVLILLSKTWLHYWQ